jgi:hypothetical protein
MIDFTDEQLFEFYGLAYDENEDELIQIKGWKPDFSKWFALLSKGDEKRWCIVPKLFWNNNGFIPDFCIGFEVEGFVECQEHMLNSYELNLEDQEQLLRNLGFEILVEPKWYHSRK